MKLPQASDQRRPADASGTGLLALTTYSYSFKKSDLAALTQELTERMPTRYGLPVSVRKPVRTGGKASNGKLTIETSPV